jgi:hypothetical protein
MVFPWFSVGFPLVFPWFYHKKNAAFHPSSFSVQAPEDVQCGRSTSSRDQHLIDFKAGPKNLGGVGFWVLLRV